MCQEVFFNFFSVLTLYKAISVRKQKVFRGRLFFMQTGENVAPSMRRPFNVYFAHRLIHRYCG